MKRLSLLILLICSVLPVFAKTDNPVCDSLIRELDHTLDRRDTYYVIRKSRIDSLRKSTAQISLTDFEGRANAYHKIFEEYQSFQGDSAFAYVERQMDMARKSGNQALIFRADMDRLFTYMSTGGFPEAVDLARTMSKDMGHADENQRTAFYYLCIRLFSDLNVYTSESYNKKYGALSEAFCDSVKRYSNPQSYIYQYAKAFNPEERLTAKEKVEVFEGIMKRSDVDLSTKAMCASILANFYREAGFPEKELEWKLRSAILDVKAGKRETLAKLDLSKIMLDRGDVHHAYRYVDLAYEDAEAYNSRYRKGQIMNLLPIIEKARYTNLDSRHSQLKWYLGALIALLVLLLVAVYYIIRQVRQLKDARKGLENQNKKLNEANLEIEHRNSEIRERNEELNKMNGELSSTLDKLNESIRIKDEYIGYGFALNAEYIRKMESMYNLVRRKLMAHQYDDLLSTINQNDVRKEKDQMHAKFDRIFLRLFPGFIDSYKALFPADDVKNAETTSDTLNSEMRIFALIRLGITDIADIALFLNYSVNTVNTYKTKAKNRSIVPNEKFEEAIMSIKST